MSDLIFRGAVVVLIFTAGYLIGCYDTRRRLATNAREITVDIRTKFRDFIRGPLPLTIAVVALLGVGVQITISSAQGNRDDDFRNRQVVCLNAYANQLYDSLKPRQTSAELLQAADQRFNHAVVNLFEPGNDKADVARVRRAAEAKQRLADQLTHERAANPYPQPPRAVCGR